MLLQEKANQDKNPRRQETHSSIIQEIHRRQVNPVQQLPGFCNLLVVAGHYKVDTGFKKRNTRDNSIFYSEYPNWKIKFFCRLRWLLKIFFLTGNYCKSNFNSEEKYLWGARNTLLEAEIALRIPLLLTNSRGTTVQLFSSRGLRGRKNTGREMEALGRGRAGTCLHVFSYSAVDQAGCTARSQGIYPIHFFFSIVLVFSLPS